LLKNEIFEYREGVVLKRPFKSENGCWVNVGLDKECKVNGKKVEAGIRVTVKLENYK